MYMGFSIGNGNINNIFIYIKVIYGGVFCVCVTRVEILDFMFILDTMTTTSVLISGISDYGV